MNIRRMLAVCAIVATAPAQDFRATLIGHVTDPSGAAIPGATVKAIHKETNASKEAKSTSEGYYTIPFLDPGEYVVEVSAAGFQSLRRENITLQVADKLNLPLRLTLGPMSQEVTVSGDQDLIDTGNADRGLVFDPVKTQEYPLNGRQIYMLMSLTPGVIFQQEVFGNGGYSGTRGWDVSASYSINGARGGQNVFLLNGAPISDNKGTWQLSPNVEAVQEFKVMTNTYDAAYGRFGGGAVNTTVKSGNNNWRGDVFEYFRNTVFDANSFQNNAVGAPRGLHNQHQFGGVVGGPIRKDKDFIFLSYEGWREIIPSSVISSVPPVILLDGKHFADLHYSVFDPLTSHACGASNEACSRSAYWRSLFPNDIIPDSRISPVARAILRYYPAPNADGLNNNFVNGANAARYHYDQPMGRWDHVFSPKDKLYALVTGQHGHEWRDATGFGPPAAHGNVNNERSNQNYIAGFTHILSSTMVLDIRASFGRFTQLTPGYSDPNFTVDKLGMTQLMHAPTYDKATVPIISLSGYTSLFGANSTVGHSIYNQWNVSPSITKSRAKHTLHAGFEYNYVMKGDLSNGNSQGTFTFSQFWTQQESDRNQGQFDGSSLATLLVGTPASGSIQYFDSLYKTRPYFGVFVQDDWKVTPRLTLNLGLRYDVQIPWLERFNREDRGWDFSAKSPLSDQIIANWIQVKAQYDSSHPSDKFGYPNPPAQITGGYMFPGVNGQARRIYETDWTNLAPRFGLAWRMFSKTVLRLGGGVFFQSPTQDGTTTGFQQTTPYNRSLDGYTPSAGLTGPYSLVNPFPNGILTPSGSGLGVLTNIGSAVTFDSSHFKIPRTYQYSLGVQQQLPRRMVVEASFAGNYQIFFNLNGYNSNAESLADFNLGHQNNAYLSRSLPNPMYGILPITSTNGSSPNIGAATLLQPNPAYGSITQNLIQAGWFRSDALQVRMEKRMFGGGKSGVLTWVLSYTFQKSYEVNHRLNDWNLQEPPIYEIDVNDKPQHVAFSGVWDLPIGKGRALLNFSNPVARGIVSGWRYDWILTYISGSPVGWPNLINHCDDWHAAHQDENSWFNNKKGCYTTYPAYSLRTLPDRFPDIRAPQKPQLNMAIEKTFHVTERYRVQFRAEGFNVTNTAIRPGPDTTFTDASFGTLPKRENNFQRVLQVAMKLYF